MKLRIGGNSIRLRLLRSEVERLKAGESLQETLDFGAGVRLRYALEPGDGAALTARFRDNAIEVSLPRTEVAPWADTEQEGLYEQVQLADGNTLAIAIEKDFACLDRSDADNMDTFAHPNQGTAC